MVLKSIFDILKIPQISKGDYLIEGENCRQCLAFGHTTEHCSMLSCWKNCAKLRHNASPCSTLKVSKISKRTIYLEALNISQVLSMLKLQSFPWNYCNILTSIPVSPIVENLWMYRSSRGSLKNYELLRKNFLLEHPRSSQVHFFVLTQNLPTINIEGGSIGASGKIGKEKFAYCSNFDRSDFPLANKLWFVL